MVPYITLGTRHSIGAWHQQAFPSWAGHKVRDREGASRDGQEQSCRRSLVPKTGVSVGKGVGVIAAGLELPWYDSGHQCAWVPVSPLPCSGQAVGSAPATLTCPKGEGQPTL